MTKRKKAGKNQEKKHVNDTANQRAMKNPKAQAILSALRKGWDGMSPEQLGEQVIELIRLKCSVRGIADELGKAESTVRRKVDSAKSAGTNSGWIRMLERTLAKKPLKPKAKSARKVPGCKPSVAPAEKGPRAAIKKVCPVKNDVHSSTVQQIKRTASSSSTSAQVHRVVNHASSDKESLPGEQEPKANLVELYMNRDQSNLDKIQQLAGIADSIAPRPYRDARSMERQGRPLPPSDPI
jgi:hypothetical protein